MKLLQIELYKLFTKGRTYIGFGAVVILVLIIELAIVWEGQEALDFVIKNLNDTFYLQGNLLNAYFVSFAVINTLWIHVPILIVIVTGDMISGEVASGTMRFVLSRPVSRVRIVTVKFLAAMIYTILMVLILAATSLVLGLALFGGGDLLVVLGKVTIIPENEAMIRFIGAYAFGIVSMCTVAALSLMISSFSNNSVGPILVTVVISIMLYIITGFDASIIKSIKPFIYTTYMDSWMYFFRLEFDVWEVVRDAGILLLNIVVFYMVSVMYFRKKDVLT